MLAFCQCSDALSSLHNRLVTALFVTATQLTPIPGLAEVRVAARRIEDYLLMGDASSAVDMRENAASAIAQDGRSQSGGGYFF